MSIQTIDVDQWLLTSGLHAKMFPPGEEKTVACVFAIENKMKYDCLQAASIDFTVSVWQAAFHHIGAISPVIQTLPWLYRRDCLDAHSSGQSTTEWLRQRHLLCSSFLCFIYRLYIDSSLNRPFFPDFCWEKHQEQRAKALDEPRCSQCQTHCCY